MCMCILVIGMFGEGRMVGKLNQWQAQHNSLMLNPHLAAAGIL